MQVITPILKAPLRVSGTFLTRLVRQPQYSADEAFELVNCIIPEVTKHQVEAIVEGRAALVGFSPNMSYELDVSC